jgi:hypothetical protein
VSLSASEIQHFGAVLALPVFQADPLGTNRTHIENSILAEQQQAADQEQAA